MIQVVISLVIVAIEFGVDSRLPEDGRVISPRRIRNVNQLFTFVNLTYCFGGDLYAAASTDALKKNEKEKNSISLRHEQHKQPNKIRRRTYLHTNMRAIEKFIADGETKRHLPKVFTSNVGIARLIQFLINEILFRFENRA